MTNQETQSYISIHRLDDVRQLALKARPDGVDIRYALEQIAGWQTARQKLPTWAATTGIVFPPHLSLEQCSSEPTAEYKRSVAERLLADRCELVDITGGFGVDFSYVAKAFRTATYVERQPRLCDIVRHNLPLLQLPEARVICADGTAYLDTISHVSMLYADPARRDDSGGKTFAISDCTPDVAALSDKLVEKADIVMIKLSPMLDWHKAVADMRHVAEVHIVSVKNECKELLLVLDGRASHTAGSQPELICADYTAREGGGYHFVTDKFLVSETPSAGQSAAYGNPAAGMYLYEPNAPLMKSGMFGEAASRYGMEQISPNSHLFLSADRNQHFHGRGFRIKAVTTMGKKELRRALCGISRANVAVRNFPMSAAQLSRRLKLADGGDVYIFATTLSDSTHVLIITEKASVH